MDKAIKSGLLDARTGGMCLYHNGINWRVEPQPHSRVIRDRDGWEAESLEEAVDAAIEALVKQGRLEAKE